MRLIPCADFTNYFRENSNAVFDLVLTCAAVTEDQAASRRSFQITTRKRDCGDAGFGCFSRDDFVVHSGRKQGYQMHSCFCVHYFELLAELLANRFAKRLATFHVEHAHSANVAREVAFLDEIGEGCLVKGG